MQSPLPQTIDSSRVTWLRRHLLRWFAASGREFPWRRTSDPYALLVAEMMLRRTQAPQVVPVYIAFLTRYPSVKSLAEASFEEMECLVHPLGLPERARELFALGRALYEQYGGRIPDERDRLLTLPGVGEYVAGAVLSVGFHQQAWMIDANVVRVFSRFFNSPLPGEARRHPLMIALARQYVRTTYPGPANLALLDHAALVCKHSTPLCDGCPVRSRCGFLRVQKSHDNGRC
jgi:A/G-specific adenine glycosylase